jgi:rare lipoprotein A (peptidoglycan hydrolase)
MSTAVASWYQDGGQTASGFHATFGFASLILGFGTRVKFCYPAGSSRCVVGMDDDHGPYVGGRTFDLNQTLAGALGFGGVDVVSWRVVR